MNHSYISVSELPYEIHSCKWPDPVKDTFFSTRGCPLTRASTILQFGNGVKHMEAVVWEKYLTQSESVVYFEFYLGTLLPQLGFVRPQKTVLDKKQSNLVPLPRGEGTPIWKTKKMELLSQANLDVSHALFVSLNWSAPRSGFTSLLYFTCN